MASDQRADPEPPGHEHQVKIDELLAFADHGRAGLLDPDYGAAERTFTAIAAEGAGCGALGESLQRQEARAFSADGAAHIEAIGAKATGA
ncbi:MAG: hypothetical protein ACRDYZ_05025 [Acidimicrobiales bacterium]